MAHLTWRMVFFHESYVKLCLDNGWARPSLTDGSDGLMMRGWCLHGFSYEFPVPIDLTTYPTVEAQRFWDKQNENCDNAHGPFWGDLFHQLQRAVKEMGFTYLGVIRDDAGGNNYTIYARCSLDHPVHEIYVSEFSLSWYPLSNVVSEVIMSLRDECKKKEPGQDIAKYEGSLWSASVYQIKILSDEPGVYVPPGSPVGGSGTKETDSTVVILENLFPALKTMKSGGCPAPFSSRCLFPREKVTLAALVMHLNDAHEWTRERIADWLETLPIDLTIQAVSKGD